MKPFYCFSIKRHFRLLIVCIALLLSRSAANAQCYTYSLNVYQTSPSYPVTSPQWVTLTATMDNEFAGQGNMSWGRIYWYTQETGGEPFAMQEVGTNQNSFTRSVEMNADYGVTVWVCYYDYWTNCETVRIQYDFNFNVNPPPPPPYLYWEYGYVCGNVARLKLNSNAVVTLYKQSAWGGNNYDEISSSSSGYFEITDYNPATTYFVGIGGSIVYGVSFDYYSTDPLGFSGNLSILSGSSTTLYATTGNNFGNMYWYDAAGNFLSSGSSYTTPALTTNTTYQLRGTNDAPDGTTCVTNPGYVTVQVTTPPPPPPPVTCDYEIYIYQSSAPYYLCSPQQVTLTAEIYNYGQGGQAWGVMNWYTQETGGQPFSWQEINTYDYTVTSSASVYANSGVTVWVSYKDYWTGCETPRSPYTFYITPPPTLYWEYAYVCGNVGKVKVNSNATVTLYKQSELGGNNYDYLQSSSTGYFEITDYDPNTNYFVGASGACSSPFYWLSFDEFPSSPPAVTGNTTIPSGTSTTLTANGDAYDYKWYDGNGNFLYQSYSYTTPVLSENVYTYQVRAITEGEVCISEPATIHVTASLPTITYSPLYNSGNFSRTIDLSKPVGTVNGSAGTTPTGATTYTFPIFASPGTNGLSPSVGVSYSSQAGNGVAGYGWNITGLSAIGRSGKNLYHDGMVASVSFTDQDAFMLDGMRLNPISGSNGGNGTVYAGEMESHSKIISNGGSSANPGWFQIITKEGTVMEFGNSTDSRIMTDNGANVMLWRLNKIIDVNGNYVEFEYNNGYRDSRIEEINYTGNTNTGLLPYNTIKFNYENRTDKATSYIAGASLVSKSLLKNISVKNEGNVVKVYQFNYGFDNLYSLLKEVTETGSDGTTVNSTIFLYGDNPVALNIESSSVVAGSSVDVFAGDYNGDGISDILAATYQYADGVKYNTDYTIYTRTAQNTSFQAQYTFPLNTTYQVIGSKQVPHGRSFITSDFDGDGRDDILLTQSHIQNIYSGTRRVDGIQINFSRNQPTNYSTTGYPLPSVIDIFGGGGVCSLFEGNYIIPGDFDGDGATDYIFILRPDGGSYYSFYTSPKNGIFNAQIANSGISASALSGATDIQPVDFDGDGKMELLVTIGTQTSILALKPNADIFAPYRTDVIYQTNSINSNCKIFPGDFDGDRKSDILVRNPSVGWYVLYATGSSFISQPFSFNQYVDISNHKIIISDFNGDGKSDILHGYDYFVGGIASTSKLSTYYSKGDATASSGFYYEQMDYNNVLGFTPLIVADLNGDGRNDFINRNYYGDPFDILYLKQNGKERLLAKVTDGHNVTASFNYRTLTDKTTFPATYNRTVSLDNSPHPYPFNYVQLPMYVLSSVTTPNGIGGLNTTTYNYEDAIVHRSAKGFLGFKKVITANATAGTNFSTQNDINTQFAVLYNTKQVTSMTSNNDVIGETNVYTTFTDLSTGSQDKRFFQKTDRVLNIDYLKGSATENVNTYDNYGNVVSSVANTGTLSGNSVNAIESVTTTAAFGTYNTPVPAKPDQITVSSSRNGASAQSKTTRYTYNATGLVATQTEFYGLPKAVTTTYVYNGFGNPITSTVAANGITSRVSSMSYDGKGRFVVSKQTGTNTSIAQTETFTHDSKWGKPLSSTSSDCITTQYEYDGFGRPKKTIDPVFTATHSLVWDVTGNSVFYSLTDYTGGKPDSKAWFDLLGRETKKQIAGFNGQWLTSVTTYNAKGKAATSTNLYYSNETPVTTATTYDTYNRLQTVSNGLKSVTYTYNKLSGGNVEVVATDQSGQNNSKTTDAAGRIISSNDKGGDLTFIYDSRGLQTEVRHGSNTLVTLVYDTYGRQASKTDKNAGTVTYEYDAFAQLKVQTDNDNHTYQMSYDELGRIINRQGPEGTTIYEYYKDVATGCSNNNLQKITGFNGVLKEYTYDNLKRLHTEKSTIGGIPYITQYDYDIYSHVNKVTYPSGVEVNNVYDNNGILTTVTGGSGGSQTTLFTGTQMNGSGRYTNYTLGNNRSSQTTYVNGFPTQYYTQGIQDLNLNWDYGKGNLLARQEILKGVTENFQYDALNRLTQTMVNNQVQLNLTYDGNSTFSMGNITSKTDAGNYTYKSDKIHAVAYITNPAGSTAQPITTSVTQQEITYTPFLKAATITEQPYQLAFTYGPDYQRVKSELQANGTLAETRIYVGNYEKQTDNAGTKELHYVYGGNGLCAIIVRQNGSNNIYVTYSDHLGSVLTLTDLSGNVVAEQNFDAWGRKRNPQNWTYNSVPPVPAWLYRGYTGHEHLTQFALIDMNGRLYDPVQGRMISPDNYIPNPFGTQGYNRYAYGNNNPMSYVDPDGNFPVFIIIAAAVFAVGNTAAHAIRGDIDNFWDGLRYFGQGAITGAALATGIGAAMQVPVLGVVIKGAAMAYAASTALSVGSAVVQSIATGNIAPLANAGRIYLGNFYLDENKSFFGGVWEGISRFTWQLPQSTIGHASAALTSAAWQVRSVTYYGGATAVETNAAGWGGVTQGSFVIGARGLQADPNNPLFQHEYGHYIQSQLFGPLYYGKVGIPSLFSTGIHNNHPTEQDANIRAQSYFNRHAPGTIWDFVENPINNPDFRLGFHWFDPIDPFGIINTIVLNNQN